ncbi:Ig-like domain-containing protein [Actinoplanes sp. GCM10030250]|uniref:Ig-like domain-containing protein n=1 Tax=Actinoplanes sp. GCM10030250 TaxID=3273376 RepID=UPI003612AE8C
MTWRGACGRLQVAASTALVAASTALVAASTALVAASTALVAASTALVLAGGAVPAHAAAVPESALLRVQMDAGGPYGGVVTTRFWLIQETQGGGLLDQETAAAAGLAKVELLADGEVVGTASGDTWTATWDTRSHPEGTVRLTTRSYDEQGRTWDEVIDGWVDHTAPTLRVYQNGFIRAGGEIAVEAADEFRIRQVQLLSGDRVIESTGASVTFLHWDPAAAEGPASLTVRAFDTARNMTEYRRTILVDNTRPVVTVAPAAGAYLRGIVPITVTSVRDASGIGLFDIFVDSTNVDSVTKAPWRGRVDTSFLADGRHTLRWWVADRAGNVTDVRRPITIDNRRPTVSFGKAPKNRARVTKRVTVTAKAADRFGVARVQLLVNGKAVATDTRSTYKFTLNPKKYGKKFTVRLRAYDRAGNVKYTTTRTYRR